MTISDVIVIITQVLYIINNQKYIWATINTFALNTVIAMIFQTDNNMCYPFKLIVNFIFICLDKCHKAKEETYSELFVITNVETLICYPKFKMGPNYQLHK